MDITEYGQLIDSAARRALSGRAAASGLEHEKLPREVHLARVHAVDAAKSDLEDLERTLSRTKPPQDLKRFHNELTRAVRAIILGHGFLHRQSYGQAANFYSESMTRIFHASDAVRDLGERGHQIIEEMELSAIAMAYLFPGGTFGTSR